MTKNNERNLENTPPSKRIEKPAKVRVLTAEGWMRKLEPPPAPKKSKKKKK